MQFWATLHRKWPEEVEGVLPDEWIEDFGFYAQMRGEVKPEG